MHSSFQIPHGEYENARSTQHDMMLVHARPKRDNWSPMTSAEPEEQQEGWVMVPPPIPVGSSMERWEIGSRDKLTRPAQAYRGFPARWSMAKKKALLLSKFLSKNSSESSFGLSRIVHIGSCVLRGSTRHPLLIVSRSRLFPTSEPATVRLSLHPP